MIKHSQPGNRRICPDYAWAFHYHRKFIDNKIGSLRGVDVFQKVLAFVKEYEEKCQKEEKLPEGERHNSAQQEPDGQVITNHRHCRPIHEKGTQDGATGQD